MMIYIPVRILTLLSACVILFGAIAAEEDDDSKDNKEQCELMNNDDGSCSASLQPQQQQESVQKEDHHQQQQHQQQHVECGVWLALSTLPGTGIGMFAGRPFEAGENMHPNLGDHCVPIVDLVHNHGSDISFLWDEYTWHAPFLRADNQGKVEVNVASSGFGAAANSFLDFLNVDEGLSKQSIAQGLHRSKDPGAGAFTHFHSRMSKAKRNIEAGQELFVSYGDEWFLGREYMGPIPVSGDHRKADFLMNKFLLLKYSRPKDEAYLNIIEEAWDTFVVNSTWSETSRVIASLPNKEDFDAARKKGGVTEWKRSRMVRSEEWLNKNGVCADNFYTAESTIPQAGHGAFARRFLKEGTPVLPVPLIHITDRTWMEMYQSTNREGDKNGSSSDDDDRNKTTDEIEKLAGYQLLLNYCLGHRDSKLLLSPYGPAFNVVNHNQTQANVRLQWASPQRSNHHPDMLEKNIIELEEVKGSRLAMELIAIRDINPNEEIFLDYGDEWEAAWQEHVRNWKPQEGSEQYISAYEMDERPEPLRTEFEQMRNPYPSNLSLKFDRAFENPNGDWKRIMKEGLDLIQYRESKEKFLDKCEIMRYREVDGRILYTAVIPVEHESKSSKLIEDVPREAFIFVDRPYTSDVFLSNAFRHDIRIPDDLFPSKWKN